MKKRVSQAAHQNDLATWEQVYDTHFSSVYNFFFYQCQDHQLAQDLTANTFEEAWRCRKRYNSQKGSYTTWLFAIARQKRAQHYRKKKLVFTRLTSQLEDRAPSPLEQAEASVNQRKIQQMIAQLPQKEQEVVLLRFGAGMIHKEIAAAMGLSDANVRKILSRVIKKLRVQWEA